MTVVRVRRGTNGRIATEHTTGARQGGAGAGFVVARPLVRRRRQPQSGGVREESGHRTGPVRRRHGRHGDAAEHGGRRRPAAHRRHQLVPRAVDVDEPRPSAGHLGQQGLRVALVREPTQSRPPHREGKATSSE